MSKAKAVLLTNEKKKGKVDPIDNAIVESASTGAGAIQITSMDQLMEFVKMAGETMKIFEDEFLKIIDQPKAEFVKKIRCDQGYTWRSVSTRCYEIWDGKQYGWWSPPSNQLAGMAICELSAKILKDEDNPKWNEE